MPTYFFGVASSSELSKPDTVESYWCVPQDAERGDVILLYCPRSASRVRQGVFAESIITSAPIAGAPMNALCSGYGITTLRHVRIKITARFTPTVTAQDMKCDPVLKNAGVVLKNFQGTTFRIGESLYQRILQIALRKAGGGTGKQALRKRPSLTRSKRSIKEPVKASMSGRKH
ncbi:MAG: hypothetical protein KIS74_00125 [Burkholderiales bacterium]|nr:hypothetical protein [Burkholderiales bacterium]